MFSIIGIYHITLYITVIISKINFMRKLIILCLFVVSGYFVFGQKTIFINENFNSSPLVGWSADTLSGNWGISNSFNAGGTAPELRFSC